MSLSRSSPVSSHFLLRYSHPEKFWEKIRVTEDYRASARRHFDDAEHLAEDGRFDNAGHLIGFAAECALKAAMEWHFPREEVRHSHFPEIRAVAIKKFKTRHDLALRAVLLECPSLLDGWDIDHRYAPDKTIDDTTYRKWKSGTTRLLASAGLKRERH